GRDAVLGHHLVHLIEIPPARDDVLEVGPTAPGQVGVDPQCADAHAPVPGLPGAADLRGDREVVHQGSGVVGRRDGPVGLQVHVPDRGQSDQQLGQRLAALVDQRLATSDDGGAGAVAGDFVADVVHTAVGGLDGEVVAAAVPRVGAVAPDADEIAHAEPDDADGAPGVGPLAVEGGPDDGCGGQLEGVAGVGPGDDGGGHGVLPR